MTAPFLFHFPGRLIVADGASARLGETLPAAAENILFITDAGLTRLGLYDPALLSLRQAGKRVIIFDAVEPDPSLTTLEAAIDLARLEKIDAVIGFGGGSSLDVAKLTALVAGSGEPLSGCWGVNQAKGPRLPLILMPTTAGTGSEVTPVAIITVSDDEKRGVSSPLILPDSAVLDAQLTLGLPASITAATGIDAMVHAIEAYASVNPNNNPVSRLLAREALRLLGGNIEAAVKTPGDIAARRAMLYGSMLAGMAFANSPVAAVHALAYPIGSLFHVPHGLSNALVLAHVLAFNSASAAHIYSEIAADPFPELGAIPDPDERCAHFITQLVALMVTLGMPVHLRDVGVTEADLPAMAIAAMKQTRLLVNNPRPVSEEDALAIYRAAW